MPPASPASATIKISGEPALVVAIARILRRLDRAVRSRLRRPRRVTGWPRTAHIHPRGWRCQTRTSAALHHAGPGGVRHHAPEDRILAEHHASERPRALPTLATPDDRHAVRPRSGIGRFRRAVADRRSRARFLADACRLEHPVLIAYAGASHIGTRSGAMHRALDRGGGDPCFSSMGHDTPGIFSPFVGLVL